eukprot:5519732-Lingulodinium_polyedra.AAC.1
MSHEVNADPHALKEFAECCWAARNVPLALKQVGLMRHPVIQRDVANAGGSVAKLGKRGRGTSVLVIYHCDSQTLFRQMPRIGPSLPGTPPAAITGGTTAQEPPEIGRA